MGSTMRTTSHKVVVAPSGVLPARDSLAGHPRAPSCACPVLCGGRGPGLLGHLMEVAHVREVGRGAFIGSEARRDEARSRWTARVHDGLRFEHCGAVRNDEGVPPVIRYRDFVLRLASDAANEPVTVGVAWVEPRAALRGTLVCDGSGAHHDVDDGEDELVQIVRAAQAGRRRRSSRSGELLDDPGGSPLLSPASPVGGGRPLATRLHWRPARRRDRLPCRRIRQAVSLVCHDEDGNYT